jgi:toxin HigB-1
MMVIVRVPYCGTLNLLFVPQYGTLNAVEPNAMSIQSFKDRDLETIFDRRRPGRRFPIDLVRVAQRKLAMLDAAVVLADLRAPPGNRLEALAGDRKGQHSIRVNDQFRICFVWTEQGPAEIEFVDYH